jgi:D-alanyl-D-alanine carboxypeptidase
MMAAERSQSADSPAYSSMSKERADPAASSRAIPVAVALPRRLAVIVINRSSAWTSLLTVGGLLLALTACAPATTPTAAAPDTDSSPTATLPPEVTAQIDQLAATVLGNGVAGAIVSVADPGRGTHLKAYGTADTAGTPMTVDMHYRIASVSKTFTAHAVLELAGQGKLSLDDPLARFVPDIPHGEVITVRDLLGLRGGVYDFATDPDLLARYLADPTLPGWSPDDALQIIRAHPDKAAAPATRTVYSNSEYVLLGYVIERASGQPAPDYLAGLIGRMGLPDTSFPTDTALPTPFSRGYIATDEPSSAAAPPRDATASNPLVPWTGGALVSTVPDMARYAPMMATGAGLPPEIAAQRQTWTPMTTEGVRMQYGLGVRKVGDWIGHEGTMLGYSNTVFHLPATGATVVVMVNAVTPSSAPAADLWLEIVRVLYPDSLPK